MADIDTKSGNQQFSTPLKYRTVKIQTPRQSLHKSRDLGANQGRVRDKTSESKPWNDRKKLYVNMKETKGILSETAYSDYKDTVLSPQSAEFETRKPATKTRITVYKGRQAGKMSRNIETINMTTPRTGKTTKASQHASELVKAPKRDPTPEREIKLPEITNEKESKLYPRGYIPASYSLHRPPAPVKERRDEDLSTVTKLEITEKNRQLIYKETQLTKAKVEKLKTHGSLDNDVYLKLKKTKEERRWDLLSKSIHDHPKTVHALWEFLCVEYKDLHNILQEEYTAAIRLHFQPRLSNLKSTPGNLLKMSDILLEITEEYDVRVRDLERSLNNKNRQLDAAKKLLHKTKAMVLSWGEREQTDDASDDVNKMAQEISDTFTDISRDKENELRQQVDANEELRKRVAKMSKALKEKDKKILELTERAETTSHQTGSKKGSQLSLSHETETNQFEED